MTLRYHNVKFQQNSVLITLCLKVNTKLGVKYGGAIGVPCLDNARGNAPIRLEGAGWHKELEGENGLIGKYYKNADMVELHVATQETWKEPDYGRCEFRLKIYLKTTKMQRPGQMIKM